MHIIDPNRFQRALKERGYRSIAELAESLGIHRNSIHYYLSGHGVFPETLEKIIYALGIKLYDLLVEKVEKAASPLEVIAPVVDRLHQEFPNVTFVLFGSRAAGTARKYSDFDVGVFSIGGLAHDAYRRIAMLKDNLIEDLPFFVDVVNLNQADKEFLRRAAKNWLFLSGRLCDWIELQRRVSG